MAQRPWGQNGPCKSFASSILPRWCFFVKVLDKDVEDCPVGPVMMDDVLDFVPPALDRLDELECVGRPICRNVFLPC